MPKIIREFREFAVKGNAIDLAVGVIIGAAFAKIVDSLVNDIIMPPLGLIAGRMDFSSLYLTVNGKQYPTLAAAKAAGAPVFAYGNFLNVLVSFLIVSFVIFLIIRQINRFRKKPSLDPLCRQCPFCDTSISVRAKKCPNCTADLAG